MTPAGAPFPNRCSLAILAALAALFTVYVSLMPFGFVARPWADAADGFGRGMARRSADSRSDVAANVLMGVPLGFALLGAVALDRRAWVGWLFAPVAMLACGLLALVVEGAQLFVPGRVCSGADVLAQLFGGFLGVAAWLAAGPAGVGRARRAWRHPALGGPAGRMLVGYVAALMVVQLLPLDFEPSPWTLLKRIYHRDWVLVPFSEVTGWHTPPVERPGRKPADWAQQMIVFAPVGVLLALRRGVGVPSAEAVVAATAGLAVALELAQFTVHSRTPSLTDATLGAASAALAWGVVAAGREWVGLVPWCAAFLGFVAQTSPGEPTGWARGVLGEPGTAAQAVLTVVVLFALFPVGSRRGRLQVAGVMALMAILPSPLPRALPLPWVFGCAAVIGAVAGDSTRRRLLGHSP